MNSHLPKRVLYAVLAFFTLTTTSAMADVEIQEVQVIYGLNGAPENLVIYGTDFGVVVPGGEGVGMPIVSFGTQNPPLTIATSQTACAASLYPPPLSIDGTDCVVAELPLLTPDGDYLLLIEGAIADANCDTDGKPLELVFTYTGDYCSASTYYPNGSEKHICVQFGDLGNSIDLVATGGDAGKYVIEPLSGIELGQSFTVTSTTAGSNLANNFDLDVFSNGQLAQELVIHLSCSAPLKTGDQFGALNLTRYIPLGGAGYTDEYDLTIGAIGPEGPQGATGEQGPQGLAGVDGADGATGPQGEDGPEGPQGPQGIQGLTGDTGAQGEQGLQGIQGLIGDTGPQGEQGPQGLQGLTGETGAQGEQGLQGIQGLTGDTGPQGEQGPQGIQGLTGDTGPQGIAGPAGAAGADGINGMDGPAGPAGPTGSEGSQGIAGLVGPEGPQGPAGEPGVPGESDAGDALLCFSAATSIGTQGKFVGLGTNSGNHADISIVIPFGARVSGFVAKASQGNTPRSGTAQLMRDVSADCADLLGRGDGSGGDIPSAVCSWPSVGAPGATCLANLNVNDVCRDLAALDSLSVHFSTDNGSVEGASACVTLEAYD